MRLERPDGNPCRCAGGRDQEDRIHPGDRREIRGSYELPNCQRAQHKSDRTRTSYPAVLEGPPCRLRPRGIDRQRIGNRGRRSKSRRLNQCGKEQQHECIRPEQSSGGACGNDRTAGEHKAQRSDQVGEGCDNWSGDEPHQHRGGE